MNKIRKGLLWFQLLVMNIGLAFGTFVFIDIIVDYASYYYVASIIGFLYFIFYIFLVAGVLFTNIKVFQRGIGWFDENG